AGNGTTQIAGEVTNSAEIATNLVVDNSGELTTATSGLTTANDIVNDGLITFNDTVDGALGQNIVKDTTAGTVEIAAADGVSIDLNGKTITDNNIKLTSGTLTGADASGDLDLTSATSIIANGGTINVQDNMAGDIALGTVNTDDAALNVAIDLDVEGTGGNGADIITATVSDATNGINISDINLITDGALSLASQIEIGSTDDLGLVVTPSYIEGENIGKIALDTKTDGGKTYLTLAHYSVEDAIDSSITNKEYTMTANETVDGAHDLGGSALAIDGDGNTITGTNDASISTTVLQTLGLKDTTVTNVELHNEGTLNLEGTNSVGDISDNATAAVGEVNVKEGTTTFLGNIVQKVLNIGGLGSNAEAQTSASNIQTTDDVNVGALGNLKLTEGELTVDVAGNGTTQIAGDVTNSAEIATGVVVDSDVILTNFATGGIISGDVSNEGAIANAGIISGDVANEPSGEISNSGTISGGVFNEGEITNIGDGTISGSIVNTEDGSISSNASNLTSVTAIQNDGVLTLTGGSIQQNIAKYTEGDGFVVVDAGEGSVTLNGKTVTDNSYVLKSGTFDITDGANADLSIENVFAEGGTLGIQDGLTGTTTLTNIDTSEAALKVAIDLDINSQTVDNLTSAG
ncbi:MAG: hypothetical protein II830_03560, partial [Alphaproteobacteria bacterium]|nr:hypothetical protein [Alphaproteobacteria bacterium]